MNRDSQNINRIVERVLHELQQSSTDAPQDVSRLVIADKVVSLESVQNRLAGVSSVQVIRGAILTPAVRDLLKEKNIQLSIGSGGCSCGCKTCKIVQFSNASPLPLRNRESATAQSTRDAINQVTSLVGKGSGVLLVADHPVAFQVLLNRNPTIRSAIVDSVETLNIGIKQIAINVAIADSRKSNVETIERLAAAFDQKPRSIPPEYKEFA